MPQKTTRLSWWCLRPSWQGRQSRRSLVRHDAPKLPKVHECIIDVQNLGMSYGSIIALRDVSTKVNAGEVTCILGDNGAGKSTLIKILSGPMRTPRGFSRSTASCAI